MTDLSIEDFKEIYLKACFANGDNTPNATPQQMADYFEYESFKFMKKYSDGTLRQNLQDMVFKKFIGGLENAKIELETPFVEYELRRLLEIDSLKVNGVDITNIELPSRYGYSIPMSMVSNRLGGRLELWVVDSIYEGFELFMKNKKEEALKSQINNAVIPDLNKSFATIKKELLSLELYDKEVLWREFYQETNTSFLKVKENSDEYIYKENEVIKIKALTLETKQYNQDLDKLVSEFEITVGAEPSFLNDLESIKEKLNKVQRIAIQMKSDFDDDHSFLEEVYSGKIGKPKLRIGHQYNFNTSFFWREFAPFFNLDSPYSGFSFKDSACFWGDNNQRIYVTTGFLYDLQYVLRLRLASIEKLIEIVSNRLKPIGKVNNDTKGMGKGFNSGFPDEQLKVLYKALIDNKFLDDNTDEGHLHFIDAFNGEVLHKDFKPLKWIDKTQRSHHISIHTVFQLLDSCKISLKGEYNIIPEVRETIKLIFENDFGNIQSKYNEFNALKTKRHTLIDSIVKDLTLNLNKI